MASLDLPKRMKALHWSLERGTLELMTVDTPLSPATDEVIVKIAYAGVCGSDLTFVTKEVPLPVSEVMYLNWVYINSVDVSLSVIFKSYKLKHIMSNRPLANIFMLSCLSGSRLYSKGSLWLQGAAVFTFTLMMSL